MSALNRNNQSNYRPPQTTSHGSNSGVPTYGGYTHRLANTGFPDRPEFFPHYRSFRPDRLWDWLIKNRLHAGNTLSQWQLVVWKEENRPQLDLSRTCDRCAIFGLVCQRSDGTGSATLGIRGPGAGGDVYGALISIEPEPPECLNISNRLWGGLTQEREGVHKSQAVPDVQSTSNNVWSDASPLFSTARHRESCCDNCRIAGGFHELHCSIWTHNPLPKELRLLEISSALARRGITTLKNCSGGTNIGDNSSGSAQTSLCLQTSPRFTPRCLSCMLEDLSLGIKEEKDRENGPNACTVVDGDVKCWRCREMGRDCTQKREFVDLAVRPSEESDCKSTRGRAIASSGVRTLVGVPVFNDLGHVIELPWDFDKQLLAISRRVNGQEGKSTTQGLTPTRVVSSTELSFTRHISAAPSNSAAPAGAPTHSAFPPNTKIGSTGKSMCLTCKNKIMTNAKNRRSAKSCESDHENGRGCSQCVNYGLVCVYEEYVMPRNTKKQSHIGFIPCESCKAAATNAVEEEGRRAQEGLDDASAAHDTRNNARSSSAIERALLLCDRKHPCDRCTKIGTDCQRVPNEQNRLVGLIQRGTPGDDLEGFYHGLGRHYLASDGQKSTKGKPWIMPDDYHFEYLKQLGIPLPDSVDEPVPLPGRKGPEPQWLIEARARRQPVSAVDLSAAGSSTVKKSNAVPGADLFVSASFAPVSDVEYEAQENVGSSDNTGLLPAPVFQPLSQQPLNNNGVDRERKREVASAGECGIVMGGTGKGNSHVSLSLEDMHHQNMFFDDAFLCDPLFAKHRLIPYNAYH